MSNRRRAARNREPVTRSESRKLRWSYRASFFVGMILALAGSTVGAHYFTKHSVPSVSPLAAEPPRAWGVLRETPLLLERPSEYLQQDVAPQEIRWVFRATSSAELAQFFQSLELSAKDLKALTDTSQWQISTDNIVVRPPLEVVRDLPEQPRRLLYERLAQTPENLAQRFPFIFRGRFEDWFAGCDVPVARLRELRGMIYRKGDVSVFADMPYFELTAPSNDVRLLARQLSRVPTLLLNLEINQRVEIADLMRYWVPSERHAEMEPLLNSLARVPGGTALNVSILLPPVARTLLYSYPRPGSRVPRNANCVWTSMNFFNTEADDRFVEERFTDQALKTQFHHVSKADAFGDIVMLYKDLPGGGIEMVHMCVHIADDVVFTKNGGDVAQPWVLMHLPDVEALFASDTGLKTMVFRRNESVPQDSLNSLR